MAAKVWEICSKILHTSVGVSFENVARWWISWKKHIALNTCTSAILWSLWNVRNVMCFQGLVWSDVKLVLLKATRMMRRWMVLCKNPSELEGLVANLEARAKQPPRIVWDESPPLASRVIQDWEALEVEDLSASGLEEGFDAPNSSLNLFSETHFKYATLYCCK